MSHFTQVKTNLTQAKTLKKALSRMGFEVVEADEGVSVRGFFGNTEAADFKILTRTHYDIGFKKTIDGSYELLGDWDLMPKVAGIEKESFTQHLKREYARESIQEIAQEKGFDIQVEESEETGEIQMVLTSWS